MVGNKADYELLFSRTNLATYRLAFALYSHSMVAGGLLLMS